MSAGKSGSTFERAYFSLIIINKLKFQITKKSISELSTKKISKKDSQEDSAQFWETGLFAWLKGVIVFLCWS